MQRHRFRHLTQRTSSHSRRPAFTALPIACFVASSPSNLLAQLELYRWAHEQAEAAAQAALDDFWTHFTEN